MYTVKNFRTKKDLKAAVARGERVETYQPGGMFPAVQNGKATIEGPHYPEPHRWYASVMLQNGVVMAVR